MSDKMTCPGCDSHTSAVCSAVLHGDPCPYCGLPADAIKKVAMIRRGHADETLRAENARLLIENGKLTAALDRLTGKVERVKEAVADEFRGI